MNETFRGIPILYSKQTISGTSFITYNQFDMGAKYRVYTKNNGILNPPVAFHHLSEAYNYFNRIE